MMEPIGPRLAECSWTRGIDGGCGCRLRTPAHSARDLKCRRPGGQQPVDRLSGLRRSLSSSSG